MRGRPRPDQGARGREGRPLALEAAALQVPAKARARLRREDAHRPQEGQLDPGALVLDRVAGFGGAWGIARSGAEGPQAEAAGEAAAASTAPPPALVEAENRQVRFLAARISEALDEAGALEAETAALLEGDETYACLLTVPGIGPRTAAQLAVSVDIGRFPDHDHLASYCGIAPRVRSSGTSVRSVRASRRGDARLKSLLIFSCNSLVRSSGRYGEYYRACRARGMGHGRALKAVARKRLRAIYAVMRDRVRYRE